MDPSAAMLQILAAGRLAAAAGVVAKLGIADELAKGPATADHLAVVVGAHGPLLYRLLRVLATAGIFAEDDKLRFVNTPLSETIKNGGGSFRAYAIMNGERPTMSAWTELIHSARTDGSASLRLGEPPAGWSCADRRASIPDEGAP